MNDDWLANGLPVFSGDKNKSLAREIVDGLGGPNGIRTAERIDADGTVTRVKLRGKMPPEITVIRKPSVVQGDYYETSINAREYHEDHAKYHVGDDINAPLRAYVLKYIKTVRFVKNSASMNFTLPLDAGVETPDKYWGAKTVAPTDTALTFPVPPVKILPNTAVSFAETDANAREFWPAGFVKSVDGLFYTAYTPIKTLVCGADKFHFLNPLA